MNRDDVLFGIKLILFLTSPLIMGYFIGKMLHDIETVSMPKLATITREQFAIMLLLTAVLTVVGVKIAWRMVIYLKKAIGGYEQ